MSDKKLECRTVFHMERIENYDGTWVGTVTLADNGESLADHVAYLDALCHRAGLTMLGVQSHVNGAQIEFTVRLANADGRESLVDALSSLSALIEQPTPARRRSRMGFPGENFAI